MKIIKLKVVNIILILLVMINFTACTGRMQDKNIAASKENTEIKIENKIENKIEYNSLLSEEMLQETGKESLAESLVETIAESSEEIPVELLVETPVELINYSSSVEKVLVNTVVEQLVVQGYDSYYTLMQYYGEGKLSESYVKDAIYSSEVTVRYQYSDGTFEIKYPRITEVYFGCLKAGEYDLSTIKGLKKSGGIESVFIEEKGSLEKDHHYAIAKFE
ncbi:MAG: hypothetical protein ACI4D4_08570 [Lachnospira sp.]